MPRPKTYANTAERVRAHRQRQAAEIATRRQEALETGLPSAPSLESIPAVSRWKALTEQAAAALHTLQEEMQAYYGERSERWQESDRGQEFADRLEALTAIVDDLQEWQIS